MYIYMYIYIYLVLCMVTVLQVPPFVCEGVECIEVTRSLLPGMHIHTTCVNTHQSNKPAKHARQKQINAKTKKASCMMLCYFVV